jgi:hypothetical protein
MDIERYVLTSTVQDCGLCHTTDEDIRESLRRRATKPEELKEIDSMSFGSIEK